MGKRVNQISRYQNKKHIATPLNKPKQPTASEIKRHRLKDKNCQQFSEANSLTGKREKTKSLYIKF